MSFWDDVAEVIAAPVTLPAKGFSQVLDNILPSQPIANAISRTFSAPYDFVHGGKLSLSKAQTALNQATPGLKIAASVAGGPLGSAAGFSSDGISLASGILDDVTKPVLNQERGGITNELPAKPTPFKIPDSDSILVPALIIGGLAIAAAFLLGRK